ncbi:hypothetical protein RHIZO_03916 [Rhizobiaceae bacterium]|nr:hypothetical protein RHIZO_03916 [Rhizobiaceae bacterium]
MKYVFAVWATPLVLFWGWYFLSLNDIHFGYIMLTRQAHDLIFQLYGQMIGMDPQAIPMLVAQACIFDTGLIVAIWAFRRRREIRAWAVEMLVRYQPSLAVAEPVQPVEHALENEGRRGGIDPRLAFLARDVHFDERPFGGYRRQPLVPEGERQR